MSTQNQHVAVVYTGGTFGMRDTGRGLAPSPSLEREISHLIDAFAEQFSGAFTWGYTETHTIIDSGEANYQVMLDLADLVRELAARAGTTAVIVIHGTDTLAYSAAVAAFALADLAIPIIYTGSQFPLSAVESDAPENFAAALRCALGSASGVVPGAEPGTEPGAVSGVASQPGGVQVVFGGDVIPAVRATKFSSEARRAFTGHLSLAPQARGVDADVAAALAAAPGKPAPRVGLVKAAPGLTARQFEAVIDDCPDGVVFESYGAGTAPVVVGGLVPVVERAVQRGTIVLTITQCAHGIIELGRYAVGSDLADAGAIGGSDLTTEAALGKLAALCRTGLPAHTITELLQSNLLGEQQELPPVADGTRLG